MSHLKGRGSQAGLHPHRHTFLFPKVKGEEIERAVGTGSRGGYCSFVRRCEIEANQSSCCTKMIRLMAFGFSYICRCII